MLAYFVNDFRLTDDDFQSPGQIKRFLKGLRRGELILPDRIETAAMPTTDPERTAEAIRRALPQLIKLDRYERRAVARRDRATRQVVARKAILKINQRLRTGKTKPIF